MSTFARGRGKLDAAEGFRCIPGLGENKQKPRELGGNFFGYVPDAFSRSSPSLPSDSGSSPRIGSLAGERSGESSRSISPRPQESQSPSRGRVSESCMASIIWSPSPPEDIVEEVLSEVEEVEEVLEDPVEESVIDNGIIYIKGGQIVNCDSMVEGDVVIEDGVITAVGVNLDVPKGTKVIDATNKYVIPGGIDTNTHLHEGMDNLKVVDDFAAGTKAGLAGGTTMVIDLVIPRRNESLIDAFNAWKDDAEENSCCDFAFSVAVPQWSDKTKVEMKELAKDLGVNSFKMFMSFKDTLMLGNNDLMKAFKHVKDLGGIAKVHAENGDIIAENQKRLLARGIRGPEGHLLAQPEEIEEEAVLRACFLAKQANVPVLICAPSCSGAAEIIKEARDRGQVVLGEPSAAALALDGSHYADKNWEHAASFITSPPLRNDLYTPQKLMSALAQDWVQMVGSDNCTYTSEVKNRGRSNFTGIPQGVNGIEDRMAIVYQKGVQEGKMKMTRFVEVTSTAAAKVFNIYPKKGCIAEGSDGDIVVWNPDNIRTISQETQHQASPINVFEGITVHGTPEYVLCKGKIVVDEYQVNASPGSGEFVKTPTFPSELYDGILDIDDKSKIAMVERTEVPEKEKEPVINTSFGLVTTRGYYYGEQVLNKSLDIYQRPLSNHGVRNQQDSTFSLTGGYNSLENHGQRSTVRVNAPPGGGGSSFW